MDYTLNNLKSAHAFLDDIIVMTKETLNDYEIELDKASNKPTQMRICPKLI